MLLNKVCKVFEVCLFIEKSFAIIYKFCKFTNQFLTYNYIYLKGRRHEILNYTFNIAIQLCFFTKGIFTSEQCTNGRV